MTYVLKKIDFKAREKILVDVFHDKEKLKNLCLRSGYFNENNNLNWVVDEGDNSYLFLAPNLTLGEDFSSYYFYFKEKMYDILRISSSENIMYFSEKNTNKFNFIKNKMHEAFLAYGQFGNGFPFEVEVKEEEKWMML